MQALAFPMLWELGVARQHNQSTVQETSRGVGPYPFQLLLMHFCRATQNGSLWANNFGYISLETAMYPYRHLVIILGAEMLGPYCVTAWPVRWVCANDREQNAQVHAHTCTRARTRTHTHTHIHTHTHTHTQPQWRLQRGSHVHFTKLVDSY